MVDEPRPLVQQHRRLDEMPWLAPAYSSEIPFWARSC